MTTVRRSGDVPEGWMLVPAEPTTEWITELRKRTSYAQVEQAIRLILATAPRHGEQR